MVQRDMKQILSKKDYLPRQDGLGWCHEYNMSTAKEYKELLALVTRQQQTIDQLTAQLFELRQLAVLQHDSNNAVTVQDFAGNITLWNRGAEKMYGWPKEQALTMNIRQIVPPDHSSDALAMIAALPKATRFPLASPPTVGYWMCGSLSLPLLMMMASLWP